MVKENEQIGFGILSLVLSIIPFFLIWLDVFDFFSTYFFLYTFRSSINIVSNDSGAYGLLGGT